MFLQGQWIPGVVCSGHFDSVEDFIWDPSGDFAITVSARHLLCETIYAYLTLLNCLCVKYRSVSTRPVDSTHHGFKSLIKRFQSILSLKHTHPNGPFENAGDVA
jgi:hypothetical protein